MPAAGQYGSRDPEESLERLRETAMFEVESDIPIPPIASDGRL